MNENILEFDKVSYGYETRKNILKDASYQFKTGVFYTIVGPSGSGKTTTLSLAGALDKPNEGVINFEGTDIKKIGYTNYRKNKVALVFQSYNLLNYMTALENVMLGMDISGSNKGAKKESAIKLLKDVGLNDDEIKRRVMRLSGGQQQRVAIARALSGDAKIILADEPTGNLDKETSKEIINIFKKLSSEHNKCVIVVTHSTEVSKEADVVLEIEKGKVVERV